MKTFTRIRRSFNASVNDALDRVENPRAMVKQMIRDMEAGLEDMRRSTVATIATARCTRSKLERTRSAATELQTAIETALQKGDEPAAREALRRRKCLDHTIEVLEKEATEADALSARMKNEMKLLEAKLREAHVKRDTLTVRHEAARSRRRLYDQSERFNSQLFAAVNTAQSILTNESDFSRLEESIDRQVAEVAAREELLREQGPTEAELLAGDDALDTELEAIRARISDGSEER